MTESDGEAIRDRLIELTQDMFGSPHTPDRGQCEEFIGTMIRLMLQTLAESTVQLEIKAGKPRGPFDFEPSEVFMPDDVAFGDHEERDRRTAEMKLDRSPPEQDARRPWWENAYPQTRRDKADGDDP